MNEILNIVKERKLQLFFLFYILLILPLLSPLAENITWGGSVFMISVNLVLCVAIFIFTLFVSSKVEKIIYVLLIVFSLIPSLNITGYLLFARALLEEYSITSLFETNPNESKEFIANYFNPWIAGAVITYTAIPVIMVWLMKKRLPTQFMNHKLPLLGSGLVIVLILAIRPLSSQVYFANFYRIFTAYKIRVNKEQKTIKERQSANYPVSIAHPDSILQTIVVVIGESQTRHHLSLYGYVRQTNPHLSARADKLSVYTDVVSPQVHTIPVIRSVFTLAEKDNPQYLLEKPSLFELFNRAGFETYLVTNQRFGGAVKASYDDLLGLAKHIHSLSGRKQNDEVVLPFIENILKTDTLQNKLIVVHLLGNHMAYKYRYPAEYEVFDYQKDHLLADAPYRDQAAKKMIDEYDNSILYNDFIIDSIIEMLSGRVRERTSLVYFSDHGEEMYNKRHFAGHAYEKLSPYMCEIPFMLWMSDSFKQTNPNIVIDTSRPFSTSNFLYSLTDLACLRYPDQVSEKSLFSNDFKASPRYVGAKKYEEVKKK